MANNTLSDLNNHLFAQLERLGDEDQQPEQLQLEINRSKAISSIAKNIIDNARVTIEGTKFIYDTIPKTDTVPDQFKLKSKNNEK